MDQRTHLLLAALALAAAGGGAAASRLRPLEGDAVSTHAPYEVGECAACHARNDRTDPGPVSGRAPQLCLECHDDLSGVKRGHPDRGSCTACHSPHDSKKKKLLL